MSNLEKFSSLIKDTITYLNEMDETIVESKTDFFKQTKTPKKDLIKTVSFNRKAKVQIDSFKEKAFSPPPEKVIKKEEIKKPKVIEKPIIKEILKETKKAVEFIKIDKPKKIEDNFEDLIKVITKISPNFELVNSLEDKKAKDIAKKYELKNITAPVTILAYKESEMDYKFLQKLSIALGIYFYPAKVVSAYNIEKTDSWDTLLQKDEIKLILSSDYTIFELKNLKKHFRENVASGKKYLKNIPLFLMPDISLYLKEPSLKRSLFQTLKRTFESLNE